MAVPQAAAAATAQAKDDKRISFFLVGDELTPGPKLIRRVFTLNSPAIQRMLAHQPMAAQRLMQPEVWGIEPTLDQWPSEAWKSEGTPGWLGNHVQNLKPSPFTSASTWRDGPPYRGRLIFIDARKAKAAGCELISSEAIRADLLHMRSAETDPAEIAEIDKLIRLSTVTDREVLIRGSLPGNAIKSTAGMATTRALQVLTVLGIAISAYELTEAANESRKSNSARPLAKEALHQAGGWTGAALGAKAGGLAAGALGSESGPFDVIVSAAGAMAGGAIGYYSSELIIRHCPDWVLKRIR